MIRAFRLTDLGEVLRIERQAFLQEAYDWIEFTRLYWAGRDTFLVAQVERHLAGYIAGLMDGGEGYIASIAVAPDRRRQGIGRALLDAVKQKFIARGAITMALHVRAGNEPAIALYRQFGFVTHELVPGYYGNGTPALLMKMALPPLV
jgi:ribosomal-protein-alanine N-acetyltransferase